MLPTSPFPPLAVGFFGLGTGYLIYGTQELVGYPKRDEQVDLASGMWGIWMPGFLQFITGVYLFLGLTLFGTLTSAPFYMAALAFTAYGVHWFALGWIRMRRPRLLSPRHRAVADVPGVRGRPQLHAEVHPAALSFGRHSARSPPLCLVSAGD